MADIQVTITGDREFIGKLNNFIGLGGLNLKRSLGASGLYLTRLFSGEVFASRGRIIGKSWPALNPSYAAWKARNWPGRPPLIQSGTMQQGFKFKEEKLSLSLWNAADHFDFHQEGTRHIPQRMMMRVDEQRAARIGKYIVSDLDKQMKQAGLV